MRKRVLAVALVVAVVALVYWLPDRESLPVADATYTEPPHAMTLAARQEPATEPVRERWLLEYPAEPPASVRLVLEIRDEIGKVEERPVLGASLAPADDGPADPTAFLDALEGLMGGAEGGVEPLPAVKTLPCTATLLGEGLSQGTGVVGARVIADAFATDPPGTWKVYRLTFTQTGAELFLAVSEAEPTGQLLGKASEYGPLLRAEFTRLFSGAAAPQPDTQP